MKRLLLFFLAFLLVRTAQGQEWDRLLPAKGYVDVAALDASIRVDLIYAKADNFMGEAVYSGMTRAWLRREAAQMLVKAQRLLKAQHPDWSLIVYDAARPMSVQRKMWSLVRGTDKTNYVANPANGGGLHNYGMAVDVSIVDAEGIPLPMGTPVDFFGAEAHTNREKQLVETGCISQDEWENRRLLRAVMRGGGFRTILYEWWHFNACTRAEAREKYPVIE